MKNLQILYANGSSVNSQTAIEKQKNTVRKPDLEGKSELEIIDSLGYPPLAEEETIIAPPVLIKKLSPPIMKIVSVLGDKEKILCGLDLIHLDEEVRK